jgi:putative ABC transport system permease protein
VIETLWQDVRLAFRTLRRAPGFTALAIGTLAVGIGANAAMFPFLYGVLTNPLGFDEADRLVHVAPYAASRGRNQSASYPDFVDWEKRSRAFESMAVYTSTNFAISGDPEPVCIPGALVSQSLTTVLRVQPILGRRFFPEDDGPGAPGTALVGYGLWRGRFGGDPKLVGRTIVVDEEPVTVVGIMPKEFRFPGYAELWLPLRHSPVAGRGDASYTALARLAPGFSLAAAQADLHAVAARLAEEYPATNADRNVRLYTLYDRYVGSTREGVVIFYVVVTMLLLLACANVANLVLAREPARQREVVVRMSLGAGRLRVARMLLTESVIVASAGGALGIVLGWIGHHLIVAAVPVEIPYHALHGTDLGVVLWLSAISVGCGILFGLAPAVQGTRMRPMEVLGSSAASSGSRPQGRLRSFLVSFEVGLAAAILVAACLVMKSMVRLHAVEPGFDPRNVPTMRIELPESQYARPGQSERFYDRLLERVRALPGVVSASAVSNLPRGGSSWGVGYYVEGEEPAPPGQGPVANHRVALPGYFATLRIPILLGRDFDARDASATSQPVVIVNRQSAERHWPGQPAIGKRVRYHAEPMDDDPWMTVVGVVEGVSHYGFGTPREEGVYRPHAQLAVRGLNLTIRTAGDPLRFVDPVRREVWALDSDLPPAPSAP